MTLLFDEDDLIGELAEQLDDPAAMMLTLAPALAAYAPLSQRAVAVAREVLGDDLQPTTFAVDWLSAWTRFYVEAARASRGASAPIDLRPERPTLFLTWHHPRYPLLVRPVGQLGAIVVQAQESRWMSAAAGTDNVRCFRTDGAPVWLARAFAAGRHVAVMIDYCYAETIAVEAPFLGRPCRTPVGVYTLARRFGYEVVVVGDGGRILDRCQPDNDDLVARVNTVVGNEILADPASWLLWPSLDNRWTATVTGDEVSRPG